MKMNDIVSEVSFDTGRKALNVVGKGLNKLGGFIKTFDPTQKLRKSPTVYSPAEAEKAAQIAAQNVDAKTVADAAAATRSAASKELAAGTADAARKAELNKTIAQANRDIAKNAPVNLPAKDAYSWRRFVLPAGAAERTVANMTATDRHPEGEYSIGRGINAAMGGAKDLALRTAGIDGSNPDTSAREPDLPMPQAPAAKKESIEESLKDILKLAGTKAITDRDNVTGLVKVKETKQLNESQDLNECGMMPSGNTTASLSINATAGSGEEVANMLKSLMDLAGVKPVTGDMLGGASAPMPMIKAIDIISAPKHDHDDHDSMEPQDDEMNKKPLTGSMEEEYANAPADPTDVPTYDPEKMVFRPNQAQQGDRMDGTMPKGNPGMSEAADLTQSLLKEYEAFKNGQ